LNYKIIDINGNTLQLKKRKEKKWHSVTFKNNRYNHKDIVNEKLKSKEWYEI